MATRKSRKFRPRKTVRGHRSSTAGKILAPLDVRSDKHLTEFQKRIKKGPLTIIMVWAEWCPHCHTMMPHFDAASKSPNRSIQSIKVEEKMLPSVNSSLTKGINKSAKPLNVEGYPSIIVVDNKGNQVGNIQPVRDTETMTKVMDNAGPLAKNTGLTNITLNKSINSMVKNTTELEGNNNKNNKNKNNKNKQFLAEVGVESEPNMDLGENELKGSMGNNVAKKNIKLNSIPVNELGTAGKNTTKKENLKNAVAPSSLNTFPESEPESDTTNKAAIKEADEVTSLVAPLTPPDAANDMDTNLESISNSLTAEQKVSGGSGGNSRGGSLYSAMARTTYTLAPAAALLATAAMVMRGKKHSGRKTHKRTKKTRKMTRRRR
jgi:thiol-disulfide isomerase/thioredoxin